MTLSYDHGVSMEPLVAQTLGDRFDEVVERFADREAVVSRQEQRRLTYAQLADEVSVVAQGLLSLGLERGDRLGMWSPNSVAWPVVQYAAAKVGLILVSINPAYREPEAEYVLRQSGCRALLSASTYRTSDYEAMIERVRPSVPELEHVIFLGGESWDDLRARGDATPTAALRARQGEVRFDDPVSIQYTSGTTGKAKGATLSHHNLVNNGWFIGEGCGYTEADRLCLPTPYYHCFGLVSGNIATMTHGGCIVLPGAGFDAGEVLEAVHEERCTSLYGVPTMFIAELDHPRFGEFDLTSLRTGIMGGSPCPVEIMRRVVSEMHLTEITIGYGMTETSAVHTQTLRADSIDRRVGTVGRVQPHLEIRIADPETGTTLPRGEAGEFQTRGYSVMLGYWDDPGRTAEAIDRHGWMHTGDLAVMDDEGYVNVVGRIKDLVIRGGENIYPREIEELLYTHPDVSDVQVIGVPDRVFGEEVAACIKLRDGASLESEDVTAFCRGQIAHFKIPRYVVFVDGFPTTATGKVQKNVLRENVVDALDLHAEANVTTA